MGSQRTWPTPSAHNGSGRDRRSRTNSTGLAMDMTRRLGAQRLRPALRACTLTEVRVAQLPQQSNARQFSDPPIRGDQRAHGGELRKEGSSVGWARAPTPPKGSPSVDQGMSLAPCPVRTSFFQAQFAQRSLKLNTMVAQLPCLHCALRSVIEC